MENVICELEELKTKYSELEDKNSYLEEKNSELAKLVAYYEECCRLNRHRQFGQSSEKTDSDSRQILLVFGEAENEAQLKKPEPSVEEITYTRRRRSCTGTKEEDFDSLPVEKVLHSIPEEDRICPECGDRMHIMGHEKRRELTIIPAGSKETRNVVGKIDEKRDDQFAEDRPRDERLRSLDRNNAGILHHPLSARDPESGEEVGKEEND